MNYRTLGKTGLKVSEIGIGTWQLAGDSGAWVGSTSDENIKSLYRFTELGGNFIDTAWVYGYSDDKPNEHPSEELIGKFLKGSGKRNDMVIATKVPPANWQWPARFGAKIQDVFPKAHIEKCIDESLKSLGVDSIDVMQFHVWQDAWANEDEWKEAITNITKSGKVKFWGISTNDYQPSNCLKTLDTGLISTIQLIFNLFHQSPTLKLFPYAKKNNIGLIARVPMDEGGLVGKFNTDTKFADGDFRNEYFTQDRLVELVKRVAEIEKVSKDEAKSILEINLRYILSYPEISTVIPGMRKVNFVDSNLAISDSRTLSPKLLEELKRHAWERNFYPISWQDPALASSGGIEL
jgi:aryl-alcohol dehydrogenase-like predicted oxidoreductase